MTDKELRKLSRLELLEVLLEESKENEKLRKALKNSKSEAAMTEGIKKISDMTKQVNEVLEFANSLSINLKEAAKRASLNSLDTYRPEAVGSAAQNSSSQAAGEADRELYWRILAFYAKNESALNSLPSDIQSDVRFRINKVLSSIKNKRDTSSQENPINGYR